MLHPITFSGSSLSSSKEATGKMKVYFFIFPRRNLRKQPLPKPYNMKRSIIASIVGRTGRRGVMGGES